MKSIDLALYERSRGFVQKWHLEHGRGDHLATISKFAGYTHIPCIVIAYWLGDVTGWPPVIVHNIETLKKFYGYEEVLNKPAGAPL